MGTVWVPSSIVEVHVLKDNQTIASQDGSTFALALTTVVPMDTCLVILRLCVVRALLLFHTHAWVLTMEYLMPTFHTLQKIAFICPRESMLWKVFQWATSLDLELNRLCFLVWRLNYLA